MDHGPWNKNKFVLAYLARDNGKYFLSMEAFPIVASQPKDIWSYINPFVGNLLKLFLLFCILNDYVRSVDFHINF